MSLDTHFWPVYGNRLGIRGLRRAFPTVRKQDFPRTLSLLQTLPGICMVHVNQSRVALDDMERTRQVTEQTEVNTRRPQYITRTYELEVELHCRCCS